jgi:hypothetical protein
VSKRGFVQAEVKEAIESSRQRANWRRIPDPAPAVECSLCANVTETPTPSRLG